MKVQKLSKTKRILFSLFPSLILVLLLVAAELLLRRFDASLENHFTREVTVDGVEWLQINRSFLRKYFPASAPMVPEFKPSLLRKEKNGKVFRVVCLGGSTMFGTPYTMTGTIPGIVRKQLRHLYPDREIEVVNLGASAINSNVVRNLMGNVIDLHPDLVLIYMGHNEFYGPDGVGASFLERWFPWLTQLKYDMRDLRIAAAFQRLTGEDNTVADRGTARNLMRQVSEGSTVRLGSADAKRIFSLFQRNLDGIFTACRENALPVIASDISSNRMFPPFVSGELGPAERETLSSAQRFIAGGEPIRAIQALHDLWVSDTTSAEIAFRLGLAYRAAGSVDSATAFLIRATDLDLLKFRAPERMNSIIRDVCAGFSVPCVSTDSLFCAQSPDGIPGDNLFWEHLHPTLRGYYFIADLFVRAIRQNTLAHAANSTVQQVLPFDPDTLSVCWLDRAYADLSVQSLTSSWPFEDYHREPEVFLAADSVLKRIAVDIYNRKLLWDEGCYRTAERFWRTGDLRSAETTYRALIEEAPYNFYAHYLLGNLLNNSGRGSEAEQHYAVSIASNPAFPNAHLDFGLLKINRGDFDGAIRELEAALAAVGSADRPGLKANIFYGLSAAHANKHDLETALRYVRDALKAAPGYPDALSLKSAILREMALQQPTSKR
jgi:tetratricopeptide (TPR) repeat protein